MIAEQHHGAFSSGGQLSLHLAKFSKVRLALERYIYLVFVIQISILLRPRKVLTFIKLLKKEKNGKQLFIMALLSFNIFYVTVLNLLQLHCKNLIQTYLYDEVTISFGRR